MTTADQIIYRYPQPSHLEQSQGQARLTLANSGDAEEHPFFFSGTVKQPAVVAQGLLLLARVARTRFYVPPNALAAVLRAADPVTTATDQGLRLESFSACCGVYARLDVDAAALDIAQLRRGVTNVDVNPPLCQALAALVPGNSLKLDVGADQLQVRAGEQRVIEEKVPLPSRWLKGFAETQMLCSQMTLRHQLRGASLRQFVQALPRSSVTRSVMWATGTKGADGGTRALRLASSPAPGAVCLAGPERLRVIEPLLRFATTLRAYGPVAAAASPPLPSAWVLELPGAHLTLALSPEKARGFSGGGALLHLLATGDAQEDADFIATLLNLDARIDIAELAHRALLPENQVSAALAVLASSGQVGFDLHSGCFFHRPLPLQQELLGGLHPRLADAHKLVEQAAVTAQGANRFTVQSGSQCYEVQQIAATEQAAQYRCNCPWFIKYEGLRGPCKHVLAVRLFLDPLQVNGA